MERRRIVRYEFVMSDVEFDIFKMVCNSDKYAYEYRVEGNWRNGNEKYYVTMTEEVLDRVEDAMIAYIGEIDFDYESEAREISRAEWELYDDVKELYNDLTNERNEEEW